MAILVNMCQIRPELISVTCVPEADWRDSLASGPFRVTGDMRCFTACLPPVLGKVLLQCTGPFSASSQ